MFHGITFLVKSFVSLARELLVMDSLKKGGCNENPTVEQFSQQEVLLNVMNCDLVTSLCGNIRGRIQQELHVDPLNARRLPKKK